MGAPPQEAVKTFTGIALAKSQGQSKVPKEWQAVSGDVESLNFRVRWIRGKTGQRDHSCWLRNERKAAVSQATWVVSRS